MKTTIGGAVLGWLMLTGASDALGQSYPGYPAEGGTQNYSYSAPNGGYSMLNAQSGISQARATVSLGASLGTFSFVDLEENGRLTEFDAGSGMVIPLGFHFGNGFALEVSGGRFNAEVERVTGRPGVLTQGSEITSVPIMASGVFSLGVTESVSLYVGGGGGVVYSALDIQSVDEIKYSFDEDSYDLGLQALLGMKVHLNGNFSVDLGYRFQNIFRDQENLTGHSLEAGFTFRF